MDGGWFVRQLDYIYFAYGIFLAALFLVCIFLHTNERNRTGKPSWLLLGLFGLTFAFHEWLELVSFLVLGGWLSAGLEFLLMIVAFLFLLEFGRRGTPRLVGARAAWTLYGVLFLLVLTGLPYGGSGLKGSLRYFLAMPAGLLAAWALFQQANKQPADKRWMFQMLSVTVAVYALSTGAIVPKSGFALAGLFNNESFQQLSGFPVQLPRTVLVIVITLLLGWQAALSTLLSRRSFFGVVLALALLTILGCGWYLTDYQGRRAARALEKSTQADATVIVSHFDDTLRSTDMMAWDLSEYPALAEALEFRNQAFLDQASAVLDRHQKNNMGLAVCFLMDKEGLTIASSNRNAPDSFVGRSYASRPYFIEAVAGTIGKYFALDATSGERVYSAGAPVADREGRILGIVAVTRRVDNLAKPFSKDHELFLVSPEGVIFVARDRENLSRALWPVNAERRSTIVASGQFGEVSFAPLLGSEPFGNSFLRKDGRLTFVSRVSIGVAGWSVVLLGETTSISISRLQGIGITFVVSLVIMFAFLALTYSENALQDSLELLELRQRNEAVLNEQLHLQQFVSMVSRTLQSQGAMPAVLHQETEIIVKYLDAAFARIWTLNPATMLLELRASGGLYTHLDGAHACIPVGQGKIGQIAQEGRSIQSNAVVGDPGILDQEWARREGMQAFAGYPLRVEGRVIGVLAMFTRRPLKESNLEALAMAAELIASYVDRKHAEEAVLAAQRQVNEAHRLANIGVWEWDPAEDRVVWSKELCSIAGVDPEQPPPSFKELPGFYTPDSWRKLSEAVGCALEKGKSYNLELCMIRPDGNTRWTNTFGGAKFDDLEKIVGLYGTVQDITERKAAEEALKKSEARYRSYIEATGQIGWVTNAAGEVVEDVPSLRRFSGQTYEEARGSGWAKALHPDDIDRTLKVWQNSVTTRSAYELEYRMRRHDGVYRDLLARGFPIFSEEGRILEWVGTCIDITERKLAEGALQEKTRQLEDLTQNLEQRVATEIAVRTRSEQMLVQQSKMAAMGEMLGAIAHQWRQPLNTLAMCVQNIGDVCAQGELDRPYIEKTVCKSMDQIQHMSATIDDFRNFYLPDKERSRFDAMVAVGDVLTLLSAQLLANSIAFRLTCHTHGRSFEQLGELEVCPEKTIDGFRNEFGHVILNLIINARDAIVARREAAPDGAPGPGLITFDFFNRDGAVIIEVGDNGAGIPEALMSRIFEPYFTSKGAAKGTGIGLPMSKIIIEDHMKGSLGARNGPVGAIFSITLRQAERAVVS